MDKTRRDTIRNEHVRDIVVREQPDFDHIEDAFQRHFVRLKI